MSATLLNPRPTKPLLKVVSASTGTFSLNKASGTSRTATVAVPDGYELVGAVGYSSNHGHLLSINWIARESATAMSVQCYNMGSANWTDANVTIRCLRVASDAQV